MDNALIQKIKEELSKNDNIAITLGKNPSVDEMAAALSLYLLLKEANKNVAIACPTQPIVELSNLVGIDKVGSKLEGGEGGDLVVSFPYVEGEIEKVSYTLENGFLNIIVKAAGKELTFNEKDVKYTKGGGGTFSLLFVIGTPILSDLGDIISSEKIRDTKIINIDNKRENQGFGDIVVVSPDFSSVSEQVADIVLSLGLRIDRDVAQNLMSGITYATKNFQEPGTSPLAFEIVSVLMRSGARRESPTQARPQQTQRFERARIPQRPASEDRAQEDRIAVDQRSEDRASDDRRSVGRRSEVKSTVDQVSDDSPLVDQRSEDRRSVDRVPRFPANEPQKTQEEPDVQAAPEEANVPDEQDAPNDWLAPKVYKGSSNF